MHINTVKKRDCSSGLNKKIISSIEPILCELLQMSSMMASLQTDSGPRMLISGHSDNIKSDRSFSNADWIVAFILSSISLTFGPLRLQGLDLPTDNISKCLYGISPPEHNKQHVVADTHLE